MLECGNEENRILVVQRLVPNRVRPQLGHGRRQTQAMILGEADHPWSAKDLLKLQIA